MPRRKGTTETVVGVFVLASLALLLAAVVLIGRRQNIFEKRYTIIGDFRSVSGLQSGAEVHLAGISIGYVQNIKFGSNDRVMVAMSVGRNQKERIRADSTASIRTMGLMGDRYVGITVGTGDEPPIEPGDTIRTSEVFGLGEMLEEARPTLQNIENAVRNISILTDELTDPAGEVGTILENIKVLTTETRQGKGTIGALLTRDDIYDKASDVLDTTQETMENFQTASSNIKEASAELPAIMESTKTSVGKFAKFSEEATEAAEGIGDIVDSGWKVMKDAETIASNLRSASQDIKEATPKIAPLLATAGEGVNEAKKVVDAAKRSWLIRGYFEPAVPGEPIALSGRDVVQPEVPQ